MEGNAVSLSVQQQPLLAPSQGLTSYPELPVTFSIQVGRSIREDRREGGQIFAKDSSKSPGPPRACCKCIC